MNRMAVVLLCVMIICFIVGCGGEYEDGLEEIDMDSLVELYNIRITAGDTVLFGVLYDTPTSREFADMLPLTVELWHPAPDFARAFDLPERIPRYAKAGYKYEIGKVTSDVSVFQEYGETITIELEEKIPDAESEEK